MGRKLVILLLFIPWTSLAAPYTGQEFTYHQPDGTSFQIRLYGDEFYAVAETLDGYVVVRDPASRFFGYATLSADGSEYVSTGLAVGQTIRKGLGIKPHLRITSDAWMEEVRKGQMSLHRDSKGRLLKSPSPKKLRAPQTTTLGTRIGLVLLVQFPDRPQDVTISKAEVDNFCNQVGYTNFGNHGSVFDYFRWQSRGRLQYNSTVMPFYYTAKRTRDYYADPDVPYYIRLEALIIEALDNAKAAGFDFTNCDANADGEIDAVNIFYAGECPNAFNEGLWPRSDSLTWTNAPTNILMGVNFQITDIGTAPTLETYCHENGHLVCDFPDLYDHGHESRGCGSFSLMSDDLPVDTWPRNLDVYCKRAAGWMETLALNSDSHFRAAVKVEGGTVYRYPNPLDAKEYFLIHELHGASYEDPADQGLIVWHIDEDGNNDNEQMTEDNHYEASVEQADGSFHLEHLILSMQDDLFHAGNVTNFHDNTLPDARWWKNATAGDNHSGDPSGFYLHSIGATGAIMTFVVGSGAVACATSIGLSESVLEPRCDYGTSAVSSQFAIWNLGTGTMSYTISTNATWLRVSPTSGTVSNNADLITVTYGLRTSGVYNGTITITSPSAANSPQTIPVTLTVEQPPGIGLNTTNLSAWAYAEDKARVFFWLRNVGGSTLCYTNSRTQPWLTILPTNGCVRGGADAIVLECNATGLYHDVYTDVVTVTCGDATNSPQRVALTFHITDAPAMEVRGNTHYTIPCGNTNFSDVDGTDLGVIRSGVGAVTTKFDIVNPGSVNLIFTGTPRVALSGATSHYFIIDGPVSPVYARETNYFKIRYTPTNYGTHDVTISIDNNTSNRNSYTFKIRGSRFPPAELPFTDGFEAGVFSNCWTRYSEDCGRVFITNAWSPHGGSYHVGMDSTVNNCNSLDEMILTINLLNRTGVVLRFSQWCGGNAWNSMPADFFGHNPSSGAAISADGSNWYRVVDLGLDISHPYQQFTVSLDATAEVAGITFCRDFKIKFQHYGGYTLGAGGFLFDDISVSIDTNAPSVPGNLVATAVSQRSFTLSWSPSTDDVRLVYYDIFRNGAFIGSVTGTNFTNTTLSPVTVYTNRVRAFDGVNYSALSSPLVVTTAPLPSFMAYHDMIVLNDDHSNVTRGAFSVCTLKDFISGLDLDVTIAYEGHGGSMHYDTGGDGDKNPLPGTDAYTLFHGKINVYTDYYFLVTGQSPDSNCLITVSNVDCSKRYAIALYANRGSILTTREKFTLLGASTFNSSSSAGVGGAGDSDPATVEYNTDPNGTDGYVARWDNIRPTGDYFRVLCQFYAGYDSVCLPQAAMISAEDPCNWPPNVDAGPDQTIVLPTSNAVLSATVMDDGMPSRVTNITWSMLSGPGSVAFSPSTHVEDPSAGFSHRGTYVLRLTADDGLYTNLDTVTVTVNTPLNQGPSVEAGLSQTIMIPSNAVMNATVTDDGWPDGIITYAWSKKTGPGSVTFSPSDTVEDPAASFSVSGSYSLYLKASDGDITNSDTVAITVNPPVNQPPIVEAGDNQTLVLPVSNAILNATVTDDGWPSGITNLTWSKKTGPGTVTFSPSANVEDPMATFSSTGNYVLVLFASDTQLSSSDTVTIAVCANQLPVVEAGPGRTNLFDAATAMNATVTDDGLPSGVTNILWSKQSGPGTVTFAPSATILNPSVSFSTNGIHVLKLTVNDGALTNFDTMTFVANRMPQVWAGGSYEITTNDTSVVMVATISDDGLPLGLTNYSWRQISGPQPVTFDPSTNALCPTIHLSGHQPGDEFELRLDVFDGQASNSSYAMILVTHPPCTLDIVSEHGGSEPSVGQYVYGYYETLCASAATMIEAPRTQYLCAGWSMAGHDPTGGTTTSFCTFMTNSAVLTWLWTTNVLFDRAAGPNGFVTGSATGWYPIGHGVVVTAVPDSYYHFDAWTGDVPGGQAAVSPLVLTLNCARSVIAGFAANVASNGTPEPWLASYGWTNDFDEAETNDPDGDGIPTWQEYIAGTQPKDSNSLFWICANPSVVDTNFVICWPSESNRYYGVYWATDLTQEFVPLQTGIPATWPENCCTDTIHGLESLIIYRIDVHQ